MRKQVWILLTACLVLTAAVVWTWHRSHKPEVVNETASKMLEVPRRPVALSGSSVSSPKTPPPVFTKGAVIESEDPRLSRVAEIEDNLKPAVESPIKFHSSNFYKQWGITKVVSFSRTPSNRERVYKSVGIYEIADFKYPQIRVVEYRREADSNTGSEASDKVIDRSAMVADHILVRTKTEAPVEALEKLINENGAQIREVNLDANMMIVNFRDSDDPLKLKTVLQNFRSSPYIESAMPDYLASSPDQNPGIQ